MNRYSIGAIFLALAAGAGQVLAFPADTPPMPVSGIEHKYVDDSVRIQDDFYRHVNGVWLKTVEIPADKSGWGAFYELRDATLPQLRDIIEAAAKDADKTPGSEAQKIVDLYASFMDEQKLDGSGLKPLQSEFDKIAAVRHKSQFAALIAHFNEIGVTAPYDLSVHQDNKDSTKYVVDISQSGLGLPDRDYYLKDDDVKLKDARLKYVAHIEKMLSMNGAAHVGATARQIVALEKKLAEAQWTKVANRDPVKTYNKVKLADLSRLAPDYRWKRYIRSAGLDGKIDYVIVSQPSYLTGFNRILKTTPLSLWKSYFAWHLLSSNAPYLSKEFSDENFAFFGTVLNGIPEQQPRWKRAIALEERAIGEGLGKLYVAQYFPPESKARMENLVANLLEAYRQSIDTLDWMGPATKKEAQAKLATFMPKIGYPSKWRDYSLLKIDKDNLVGNLQRANLFEYQRNINKLGQPIDRAEWGMTPQTVNAYYNPELNEVVFPAAILQPPFFNAQADDAVNYGAIGAVIGHEISHGFDDQGAQYDGNGNLRDWWSKEDHEKFAAKTAALIKQYDAYSPLSGYHVNGELTLGENIADNSGLAIAYKAYKLSLGGRESPVIDSLTGEQRFYLGFGQVWRGKVRDNAIIVRIKTDPHSPPEFRGNGTVKNQPGFYSAFGVNPGDAMYLPPDQRVIMW